MILAVGGFFFFKYWDTNKDLVVWDLVPESAILVYESTKSVENWNEIQDNAEWDNLEQIPFYASIGSKVKQLDSLSGSKGKLHELLRSKPFVFSLHRVAQDQLDYVFFISLNDLSDFELIRTLAAQYRARDDFRFQDRTYQDIIIHEAVNNEYEEVFSYLMHKNYFIGSFTPFLVEDVIRNITDQTKNSFAISNPKLFEVAKLDNDQGNVYINNQRIPQLLSVFANESLSPDLLPLGQLAHLHFWISKSPTVRFYLMASPLRFQRKTRIYSALQGVKELFGFRTTDFKRNSTLYYLTFKTQEFAPKIAVLLEQALPAAI